MRQPIPLGKRILLALNIIDDLSLAKLQRVFQIRKASSGRLAGASLQQERTRTNCFAALQDKRESTGQKCLKQVGNCDNWFGFPIKILMFTYCDGGHAKSFRGSSSILHGNSLWHGHQTTGWCGCDGTSPYTARELAAICASNESTNGQQKGSFRDEDLKLNKSERPLLVPFNYAAGAQNVCYYLFLPFLRLSAWLSFRHPQIMRCH